MSSEGGDSLPEQDRKRSRIDGETEDSSSSSIDVTVAKEEECLFTFGVIADTQYADEVDQFFEDFGYYLDEDGIKRSKLGVHSCTRRYRNSLEIVKRASSHFASLSNCPFAIQLGDVLDKKTRKKEGDTAVNNVQTCKQTILDALTNTSNGHLPLDFWHFLVENTHTHTHTHTNTYVHT